MCKGWKCTDRRLGCRGLQRGVTSSRRWERLEEDALSVQRG